MSSSRPISRPSRTARGYECQHVNAVGLRGKGDPIIMNCVLAEDWTRNEMLYVERKGAVKRVTRVGSPSVRSASAVRRERAGRPLGSVRFVLRVEKRPHAKRAIAGRYVARRLLAIGGLAP